MKIIWTDKKRFVPKVGILSQDDIIIVPDEIAHSLIKQGQAKKYERKILKTKEK